MLICPSVQAPLRGYSHPQTQAKGPKTIVLQRGDTVPPITLIPGRHLPGAFGGLQGGESPLSGLRPGGNSRTPPITERAHVSPIANTLASAAGTRKGGLGGRRNRPPKSPYTRQSSAGYIVLCFRYFGGVVVSGGLLPKRPHRPPLVLALKRRNNSAGYEMASRRHRERLWPLARCRRA